MVDLSKYKALFLSESLEHLQSMNECFLKLERGEKEEDTIATAFRNAHSIKGMSASMGYNQIRDLAHSMEDLLDQLRQKQRELDKEIVEVFFQAVDRIEKMLKEVEQDKEFDPAWEKLTERIQGLVKKKPTTQIPESAPTKKSLPKSEKKTKAEGIELSVLISPSADSPSVRALILLKRLEELGKIINAVPSREEIKQGKMVKAEQGYPVKIFMEGSYQEEQLNRVLSGVSEIAQFEFKQARLKAEPEKEPTQIETAQKAQEGEHAISPLPQTVRVKTQLLDDFINSLGEMILIKGEMEELYRKISHSGLRQGLDRMERLIREFHDQVMSARLMPIELLVQRLPRLVRDLAREEGKEVEIEILGKEIELDRALIEKLPDPLVHIIRNSVSHGIEPPEKREKLGKNRVGRIIINAVREHDLVLLSIADDGQGIDPKKIAHRALDKGLISKEQAEGINMEQAINLLFMPGFSTAEKVGMLSGRGVGMDVVKSVVEGMGGMVSVFSELGKGTTITLHLPQTVAIVNVLLISLANEIFAIPISRIMRSVEVYPYQVRKSQNQEYYVERQELIPLLYFHKLLDLKAPENHRFPLNALLVEGKKKKMALVVDELKGQEQAFIRPLGRPLERIPGLGGVTMLGDGRIVFVLDLMSLF